MIQIIYLHPEYYKLITAYGDINIVVNTLLDYVMKNNIEIDKLPLAPPRIGATKYKVIIINNDYLELIKIFGIRSTKVSLRRLLYWALDTEILNELLEVIQSTDIQKNILANVTDDFVYILNTYYQTFDEKQIIVLKEVIDKLRSII